MTQPACKHVEDAHDVTPSGNGCVECLQMGSRWVHLRLCMSCGHVGCCDSSPNRHARAHAGEVGHGIVEPFGETGDKWRWCFIDEVQVG